MGTVTGYPARDVWTVETLRAAMSRILDAVHGCLFTVLVSDDGGELEVALRCDVEGAGGDYEVARAHFERRGDLWLRVHGKSFGVLDSADEFRVAGRASLEEALREADARWAATRIGGGGDG